LKKRGLVEFSSNGVPYVRKYLDESQGIPVNDIWTDTGHIKSKSKENENYPTQKPERLLERIIKASSNPGDLVLDCFMGSGTTQAVAMKLGRRFLGADINLGAVEITNQRLLSVAADLNAAQRQQKLDAEWQNEDGETRPIRYYTGFSVYNVNHYDVFRNPVEARGLLLEALEIQSYPPGHVFDGEKDGQQVKLMPVNRIATRADINDLIANLDYKTLERRHADAPNQPTERILLVCMGHEPDLAAQLQQQVPFKLAIRVYDVLRDGQHLTFKRPAEAHLALDNGELVIDRFYPMNLLQKLSLLEENVDDWRQLVETVKVDWQYNGQVFAPVLIDAADGETLVKGRYPVPPDAALIKVKITDLLSESWEGEISASG
jgi:site-specific DNA-methyltransferase (adenine-specific)/adenine-specific DNA-methyltransferase